jgi:hypothetical protein
VPAKKQQQWILAVQALAAEEQADGAPREPRLASRLHADFGRFGPAEAAPRHGTAARLAATPHESSVDTDDADVRVVHDRTVVNTAAVSSGAGVCGC